MFRTDRENRRIRKLFRYFWGILFLTAVLLQILARKTSGFAEWYAKSVYPGLMRFLGGISDCFPFALDEVLIYLMTCGLVFYVIYGIIRIWKEILRLKDGVWIHFEGS